MPKLTVNGTALYHEVRGGGPPLLLIICATGDGGGFENFAEMLSDEFAVITYDRRGNGPSPRPPGWETTSPEEQADDATALLLIRHPEVVRGAILHEPALFSLFDDPSAVRRWVRRSGKDWSRAGRRWRRSDSSASWPATRTGRRSPRASASGC